MAQLGLFPRFFSAMLKALEISDITGSAQVTALFQTADGNIILFKLIHDISFTNVHHIQCQRGTQVRASNGTKISIDCCSRESILEVISSSKYTFLERGYPSITFLLLME